MPGALPEAMQPVGPRGLVLADGEDNGVALVVADEVRADDPFQEKLRTE